MLTALLIKCFELVKRYWLVLTVINLVLITLLSLTPLPELPTPGNDKTHHILAYACLVFPNALRKHVYWMVICFLCIMWGGMIELVQPYVNRYGEWLDVAANTFGVLMGVSFAWLINFLIQRNIISHRN